MPNPRRLLVITELFLPTKGGTAVWFDAVYRRLGGKEIHIVTAQVPNSSEIDRTHPNTIHRIALKRHWWLRPESLAMYLRFLIESLYVSLTNRICAVHAGRVLPEGFVGWLIARLIRKPIVIYAHGEEITTWRQVGKYHAMRFTYRHADRIIANSDFTRRQLLELGVQATRISLISPGVDTQRFRPNLPTDKIRSYLGIQDGQRLILSVGRLSRRKGFDQVIRSIPLLIKEGIDARYALIGIGEDRDYLSGLAQEHGIADRVHLLGHVPTEDLPLWYNACDVFIMPNREIDGDTEGFGMVFLEAAACGKPAIAGDAGGTGAAVQNGVTGYLVKGEDVEKIADTLKNLLINDALRIRMGQAGFERAHSEFSWDAVSSKTAELIDTIN